MKSTRVPQGVKTTNSARKTLSTESIGEFIPSTPDNPACYCDKCIRTRVKKNPSNSKPNFQGNGDFRKPSKPAWNNSRPLNKPQYLSGISSQGEPNFLKSRSSSNFALPPRKPIRRVEAKDSESLVHLFRAPSNVSRASSTTEAVPVLRKSFGGRTSSTLRRFTSKPCIFKGRLPPLPRSHSSSTNTACPCNHQSSTSCKTKESQASSINLRSKEVVTLVDQPNDCHSIHPAHLRRVNLAAEGVNENRNSQLPPRPPPNTSRTNQRLREEASEVNRQFTAVLSVGANTVGGEHLNNYHQLQHTQSSPSFIVETIVESDPEAEDNKEEDNYTGTLPFSRENEPRRPSISHSRLHGTESFTNLHRDFVDPPCESRSRCPLCQEGQSKTGVHHQAMQSRYMTDLEWRICHAVNIYVYRNGIENQTPILVHIPPARKKSMKHVMSVIQDRMKYPIGYAKSLYKMDGTKIRHPCELDMYNNYVVGSNYDKHFKCVQYGRKRSPLLILSRESKHVRVLRQQNDHYNQWLLKKKAAGDERPQYVYPILYTKDGYGPGDLPVGQGGNYQPCGPFCKLPNRHGCGTNFDHENCGPNQSSQMMGRKQQEYVVNTMTIPTKSTRNPGQLLRQQKSKMGDFDNLAPNTRKYRSTNEEDGLFHGAKGKKKSKGVIDISGDQKLFATGGIIDINANMLRAEQDEIPDLSDPDPPPNTGYNEENDLYDIVDETLEENQNGGRSARSQITTRRVKLKESGGQDDDYNNTTVIKPPTNLKTPRMRSTNRNNGCSGQQPVAYFIPLTQEEEEAEAEIQNCNLRSSEESLENNQSQGFNIGSDPVIGVSTRQNISRNNRNNNEVDNNNFHSQQNQPIYQASSLNQGSSLRPFIVDGSSRISPRTGQCFQNQNQNPEPQQISKTQNYSARGTVEVDIPFTPVAEETNFNPNHGTYQPLPSFYPPYQDYRFLPNNCQMPPSGSCTKTTIDQPKVRNVATQFGSPSFEEIRPTIYKNNTEGHQQMLLDSLQTQQMKMQQAIIQQQQFASQLGNPAGTIIYQPPPVYIPAGPTAAAAIQQQQQQGNGRQQFINMNMLQQQYNGEIIQGQSNNIPPPTQFRDMQGQQRNCQDTRRTNNQNNGQVRTAGRQQSQVGQQRNSNNRRS